LLRPCQGKNALFYWRFRDARKRRFGVFEKRIAEVENGGNAFSTVCALLLDVTDEVLILILRR
jgi:hypothetical protein